jgi:hypothetical protein
MLAVEKREPSRARVNRSCTQRTSVRSAGVGRQAAPARSESRRPSAASANRAVAP